MDRLESTNRRTTRPMAAVLQGDRCRLLGQLEDLNAEEEKLGKLPAEARASKARLIKLEREQIKQSLATVARLQKKL